MTEQAELRTAVVGTSIAFRLADPEHRLRGVRLACHLDLSLPTDLAPVPGGWELSWLDPPVDRVEYEFVATDGDHTAYLLDPGNPRRIDAPFGPKSVLELAGYAAPAWLRAEPAAHHRQESTISGTLVGDVDLQVWSPADAHPLEPLPMLLAHDGPELDRFARLTHFTGVMVSQRRLPRMRLVLLSPGERNLRYSAHPGYAAALTGQVVPALLTAHPSVGRPVLLGCSLGALAALHAEWSHPGSFGGLYLASGSFFTPPTDSQESGFQFWGEVTRFVASVHDAPAAPSRPPTAIVCGSAEENLPNNRLMAARLQRLGVAVSWGKVRDGHTFATWRDLVDPHLVHLLTRVWN